MSLKIHRIPFPWLIFIIALVIRLLPVILARNMGIGLDDMFQYDMLGRSIIAGNGYRWYGQDDLYLVKNYIPFDLSTVDYDPRGVLTSFRPPLYPAFLAIIYFFSGINAHRFFIVRLVQAVLNALLVPMTYLAARQFFPNHPRTAHWSAWVLALYPLMVIYPLSLATENLFFVLVLASVLALLKARNAQGVGWYAISGMLIGLSALTRSVIMPLGIIAALWAWLVLRNWKGAAIILVTMLVVCLPWIIRNSLLHGRLVGIESSLGYNLYVGYHPKSTGTFQYGISLDLIPILDDGLRDKIGTAKAIEFIRANPSRVPLLALMRLGHFFGLERRALIFFYSNNFFGYIATPLLLTLAVLLLLPFIVLSTSSVFGLILAEWRKQEVILLGLVLLTYLIPHVLILAEDRFHLTIIPFLAILAARCWDGGYKDLKSLYNRSRTGKILVIVACLAVALLFINWGYELSSDSDKLMLLFGPNGNHTGFPY
jgi:4-amino-4-deoxy-L-arabinose transferase-like glycosyltransferase